MCRIDMGQITARPLARPRFSGRLRAATSRARHPSACSSVGARPTRSGGRGPSRDSGKRTGGRGSKGALGRGGHARAWTLSNPGFCFQKGLGALARADSDLLPQAPKARERKQLCRGPRAEGRSGVRVLQGGSTGRNSRKYDVEGRGGGGVESRRRRRRAAVLNVVVIVQRCGA
ncbi:hypothetical protein MPTK1_2g08240 [Marchantia polymorpha subsp. ruderalis]|uniref:Uncharacterized protein n=1 Tax=Marchantia polymorpha TaxID=3197 RepID=A0A2R6XGU7_MARPO|nr:hypothetical protein MARPO_0015s0109 [Marchantia polymorpha]BBN01542.1 hypothetical protein Mp_2g08240 [Marchantia polymorpha subsp. ruderalis]|eukprot:PTQ45311.1 hypothetical protein MARPO_0015s0109 [Marchantia polymorpha]